MILMLAPPRTCGFPRFPAVRLVLQVDADGLITIASNSAADQLALMAAGCRTLLPIPQGLTSRR